MKVITPEQKHRAAELVGMGLTQKEASKATDMSEASIERVLRQPEYRKVRDDTARKRTSLQSEVGQVVRDLLDSPNLAERRAGAEMWLKNPHVLDDVEQVDDEMLPGVRKVEVLIFPGGETVERVAQERQADGKPQDLFSQSDLAPVDE